MFPHNFIDNQAPPLSASNLNETESVIVQLQESKADKSTTYTKTEVDANISNHHDTTKVDKVTGKQLSTNDYTNAEKTKLAGLENYDDTSITSRVTAIENKEDGWDAKADLDDIPTNVSELTNDSGFISDAPSDGKKYARRNEDWIEVVSGGGESSGDYLDLINKPHINGVELDVNNTPASLGLATTTDISDMATETWVEAKGYDTEESVDEKIAQEVSDRNSAISSHHDTTKQDVISDLSTIRTGASAGATAVQPGNNVSRLTNDAGYLTLATLPKYNGEAR